jgi:hypothetical protein
MPGFRSDNARIVHPTIVIHDFDQWTHSTDGRTAYTVCGFIPESSQGREG